jgi:hypothetical protein
VVGNKQDGEIVHYLMIGSFLFKVGVA